MGQRSEPRTETRLAVRIFGTDARGKMFSENVHTVDISRTGAKLGGIQAEIKAGEVIGVSYGTNKGRFVIKWVGAPGTPRAGQVGVVSLTPEKSIWDAALPGPRVDPYLNKTSAGDRRQHPRMRCVNSVQLQPEGQAAPIWGKAVDLSRGGCFVEMPMPLATGTRLKIGLWLNQTKLQVNGRVVNARPGFGIGVQFFDIPPLDMEKVTSYLRSISQIIE